jgi:hypothetical protein
LRRQAEYGREEENMRYERPVVIATYVAEELRAEAAQVVCNSYIRS